MRPPYSRPNAAVVTAALCQHLVQHLLLHDSKRSLTGQLLARLLLLAAVLRRSLSGLAQRCQQAPSDETVRLALLDNLPGRELLLAYLVAALHALLPAPLRKRPQPAALDYHERPFYGDRDTAGLRPGQAYAGTKQFFCYATLALLVRGRRYTVGLAPVAKGDDTAGVVHRLLQQAERAGVRLAYLLLDRGFYDATVVALLQQQRLPS